MQVLNSTSSWGWKNRSRADVGWLPHNILSQGWPPEIDEAVVWHLRDITQQLCPGNWVTLDIREPDIRLPGGAAAGRVPVRVALPARRTGRSGSPSDSVPSCGRAKKHPDDDGINLEGCGNCCCEGAPLMPRSSVPLPEVTSSLGRRPKAWAPAAAAAAEAGFLPCLKHLPELDASLVDKHLLGYAAASGDLECLAFVHEAGFRSMAFRPSWNRVVASGNPAILAFVLDNLERRVVQWDAVMEAAVNAGALECRRLLYARGYTLRHDWPVWSWHPVVVALQKRPRCGALRRWGGIWDYSTTAAAAGFRQLGALRFVHEWGAPWDVATLNAAVCGGSLERPQHGCPYVVIGSRVEAKVAHTLQVLRYACEEMEPTWAQEVVRATASAFANLARQGRWGNFNWELLLYLARRHGGALPPPLAKMVAVRRKRAAAFAGVFYKAAKAVESQQQWPGQPSRDLCEALAKVAVSAGVLFGQSVWRVSKEPVWKEGILQFPPFTLFLNAVFRRQRAQTSVAVHLGGFVLDMPFGGCLL
eukprot:jgi/Botrbrau1/20629/Bobra.113_1s0054.1